MSQLSDTDYSIIFNQLPVMILLLDAKLNIVAATDMHLENTMKTREQVINHNVLDVYIANSEDISQTKILENTFKVVLLTKKPHFMEAFKFDVANSKGEYETKYWATANYPVLDGLGNVKYIINRVEDITTITLVKLKLAEQEKTLQRQSLELLQINEIIQKDSKMKSLLLSNISHELRTPLTGMSGYLDLLTMTPLSTEQQEIVQIAKDSSLKLEVIIANILDLTKLQSGQMVLNKEFVNLCVLGKNVTAECEPFAKLVNNQLIFTCDLEDKLYHADKDKIKTVLVNLVRNGIKFTDNGDIHIKIGPSIKAHRADIDYVQFSVQDSGIGIAQDKQEVIFTPFSQVDNSDTRKYGGTGLGLTICKSLVSLMDGEIYVESELDKGSTFYVILPLPKAVTSHDTKVEEKSKFSKVNGIRVLIADDDKIIQKLLIKQFSKFDASCETANNGAEAVDLYKNNHEKYDCILMDIQMPVMDGFDATRSIRKIEEDNKFKYIPIITMSASSMISDRVKSFKSGMDDFIAKPFTIQNLITTISRHL